MLLLTRRVGEVICIGDDIEIMITELKGTYARIGIKAPANVKILRKEIVEREAAEVDGNK